MKAQLKFGKETFSFLLHVLFFSKVLVRSLFRCMTKIEAMSHCFNTGLKHASYLAHSFTPAVFVCSSYSFFFQNTTLLLFFTFRHKGILKFQNNQGSKNSVAFF